MHELRVDTWLSARTANILQYHGFDLSKPNSALHKLVLSNEWRQIEDFGPKRREELLQALLTASQKMPKNIESAIQLLEENGYKVTLPT
jgi:spore germination protein YaaH